VQVHLYWNLPSNTPRLVEVSAVLEVVEAPTVSVTYFWALQASFTDALGQDFGAGHLGLQWYPPHPQSGGVNWGGYPPAHSDWQVVIEGSASPLPSATNDPNTRDYPWRVGIPYLLRIFKSPERGWRGTVTDLSTGVETLVRDLWAGGDELSGIIVWSEWFCECNDPRVVVRWSGFHGVDQDGGLHAPQSVTTNHPHDSCKNTTHIIEADGPSARILQVLNTKRSVASGTMIPIGQ
jgi:hypothetical protein